MPDAHGKSLLKCDPRLPIQRWACVSYTENRTHDTSDRNCVTSEMNKVIKESTTASVCFCLSLSSLSPLFPLLSPSSPFSSLSPSPSPSLPKLSHGTSYIGSPESHVGRHTQSPS